MSLKRVTVVIGILVVAGWLVFSLRQEDVSRREVEALARRESLRRQQEVEPEPEPKIDFDALARAGQAQPVPDGLFVGPDPGGFWFVGNPGHDVGVEIPFSPGKLPTPPPVLEPLGENPGFLGADACRECHQERHSTFVHTAHHRTSSLATNQTVKGSFRAGSNRMLTVSPDVHFTMIDREGKLFQRVSFFDWNFEVPFHIVTGSAKIAQTFVYWHGDALYEMNVTYLAGIDDWINSPGFVDGDAAYARPIGRRCLECHTTYIDFREAPNHFTPGTLITGISCERCHGPGRDHVDYHKRHPQETTARHVIVPSNLPRRQQLDLCSQCHSGVTQLKGEAYQFRPGDALEDHYHPADPDSENEVHTANQVARLSRSRCFTETEMTCIDCHNPHQNERGKPEVFSKRCLGCHEPDHCGMEQQLGDRLSENCIDCHMPSRSGNHLKLHSSAGTVLPPLRDHHIRVDTFATQAYLQSIHEPNR